MQFKYFNNHGFEKIHKIFIYNSHVFVSAIDIRNKIWVEKLIHSCVSNANMATAQSFFFIVDSINNVRYCVFNQCTLLSRKIMLYTFQEHFYFGNIYFSIRAYRFTIYQYALRLTSSVGTHAIRVDDMNCVDG